MNELTILVNSVLLNEDIPPFSLDSDPGVTNCPPAEETPGSYAQYIP